MKKTIIAVLASSALVFAACGSDSDGGSDGGGGAQSEVAALMTGALDDAGIDYDADCINDAAGQLSDEDAEAIVAAGMEGDPDVSDEADAIGDSLADCIELDTEPTTT
jgi:hypothetical protein